MTAGVAAHWLEAGGWQRYHPVVVGVMVGSLHVLFHLTRCCAHSVFVSRPAEDFRTTVVYHGRLKLQALPVMLFANGHVAFVQRIPWR